MDRLEPDNVPPRLLIAEDERDLRELLTDSLIFRGYHCTAMSDGALALHCLHGERFDLVITDYHMPTMDGIQLLECLQKQPDHTWPPVILLTAHTSVTLREKALELGAYAVVAKPYDIRELAILSVRAIQRRKESRIGQSDTPYDLDHEQQTSGDSTRLSRWR